MIAARGPPLAALQSPYGGDTSIAARPIFGQVVCKVACKAVPGWSSSSVTAPGAAHCHTEGDLLPNFRRIILGYCSFEP